MNKEIQCLDCGALFEVEVIEESNETNKIQYCPYCGGEDVVALDDEELEDEYSEEDE